MPLDLSKPIGASTQNASLMLPSKTSMNLLVRERKGRGIWKYLLGALVLAALVAAFTKFAVLDVFKQVDLKRAELSAVQQEYSAVASQLDNYESVLEEYRSYTGNTTEGAIDALQVMTMVSRVVEPYATVVGVGTAEGQLLVNIKDTTLDDVGKLADILRSESLISDVVVTTASESSQNTTSASTSGAAQSTNQEGTQETEAVPEEPLSEKSVAATLQITLVGNEEEGGQ